MGFSFSNVFSYKSILFTWNLDPPSPLFFFLLFYMCVLLFARQLLVCLFYSLKYLVTYLYILPIEKNNVQNYALEILQV